MRHLLWLYLLPLAHQIGATPHANDTLLWGVYRPNLYFGVRPRLPQSLMTGLMWFGTQDIQSIHKIRHSAEQSDGLSKYTWTEYDPRQGGRQILEDAQNNVRLTTEFIKVPGGEHGGSWAARIKGEPMDTDLPSRVSTIFYFGLEGIGGLSMDTDEEENGIDGIVKLSGFTPDLDDFTITIKDGPDNNDVTNGNFADAFRDRIGKTHFLGQPVQSGQIWKAKDNIFKALLGRVQSILSQFKDQAAGPPDPAYLLQLPDEIYTGSSLYAFQKSFDGPFQFDVFFDSASNKQRLSSSILDEGLSALASAFEERFKSVFPVPTDFLPEKQQELEAFSRAITSNLIGGVGYFYGPSIVDKKFSYEWDEEEDLQISDDDDEDAEVKDETKGARLTPPRGLLTATPSRSFFPRGFYWDEGFHLLHIGEWDNGLSVEILKSWFDMVDADGWIAREQILGEEARSRVPKEFQTQVPNYANPPTLTMAVTALISRLAGISNLSNQELGLDTGPGNQIPLTQADLKFQDPFSKHIEDPEITRTFLTSLYPNLKKHYEWFRRTQRGQIKQYSRSARSRTEGYRWRGRTETHVLTSGMDDYPRGPPHAGELHLDLISWMGFFSRTMREVASFIGENDDALSYTEIEKAIIDNIEDLHWNEDLQMYCDANVDDNDDSYHVCHKGYLSLFPFILELLPPASPHLGAILDLLRDPNHLWSPFGIRSLSASHPEFGQGENYWRGPIWVQMNYLALRALYKTYAAQEGPYQTQARQIYEELRRNLVNNVFKEYERTGFVWEQYDPTTGEGKRSHPFTGWTSLVTLVLSEKY